MLAASSVVATECVQVGMSWPEAIAYSVGAIVIALIIKWM